MRYYLKRRICLLLAILMVVGLIPITAQEAQETEPQESGYYGTAPTFGEEEIFDLPEFLVDSQFTSDNAVTPFSEEIESITWTVNPADGDENVARVGSSRHILELTLTMTERDALNSISSATLVMEVSPAFGARRLAVWTDLSAGEDPENLNDVTFLSAENLAVPNRIVRTPNLRDATTATLQLPVSMISNGAATASKIYIAITTDANLDPGRGGNPEALTLVTNHRGGGGNNEFDNITGLSLNATEALPTMGVIFDLQSHIANMPLGTFTETNHILQTHPRETPPQAELSIVTGGSPAPPAGITRYLNVVRTQANRTRGMVLRNIPLEAGDTITITGNLITTTEGLRMAIQAVAATDYMQSLPIGSGDFEMTYTVSTEHAQRTDQSLRIIAHGAASIGDVPATFRVYNIVVNREDRSAEIVRVPNPTMGGAYEIVSPYASVNWDTWFQFRTAHHTHTRRSDGSARTRDMLVDHYNRGFSIVATTDHNVLDDGDWTTLPPEPTVKHWEPGEWNSSANQMTTEEQNLIRGGTWTVGSGRQLPPDSRFSALGFMRPQMRQLLELPGPVPTGNNAGMIAVPHSIEQTIRDHVLTYWVSHNSTSQSSSVDSETVITSLLDRVENSTNGVAVLAHPGRHTCGRDTRCSSHSRNGDRCAFSGATGNVAASNLPREVNRYIARFRNYPSLLGMEVYNRPDHESRSDRILWDNILLEIMPQRERNVWGFANDDSHSMDGTGLGWNVMLMPELTDGRHRTAMHDGTFYMVSRVDRRLGVNSGASTGAAGGWHVDLMNRRAPSISNISVSGQTITIKGANYDEIIWITGNPMRAQGDTEEGGGVVILAEAFDPEGNSLNLSQLGRYVWGNYVRAVLICRQGVGARVNSHGVALTQPIGIYRADCTVCLNNGNCCSSCGYVCDSGCSAEHCEFLANPIRHMNAQQVVDGIIAGWNLGNTFDATGSETQWIRHVTTRQNIRDIKNAGFNAIRIPVTWTNIGSGSPSSAQAASTWTIPSAWMNRVREVVTWAYEEDMYVIMNIHHENFIYQNLISNTDLAEAILVNLWTQITGAFNNQFGYRLIFAGLNEPRVPGLPTEWRGGTPEERLAINRLNQTFVNTVRASGGNNAYRSLMVPTHAASATNLALRGVDSRTTPPSNSAFVMPNDPTPGTGNRLIMSVHTYSPFDFTFRSLRGGDDNLTQWSTTGTGHGGPDRILSYFSNIETRANELNVPVILGEWGSEDKGNTASRVAHATFYVSEARKRGWPTFWWDNMQNSVHTGSNEYFGIYHRPNGTWVFPQIRDAILAAAQTGTINPVAVTVTAESTTVPHSGSLQFSAAVAPASASQAVAWTINPPVSGASVSATGVLTVTSSVAAGTQITVRATAVGHNSIFGQRQVTVAQPVQTDPVLQSVTVPSTFNLTQAVTSANDAIQQLPQTAAITTLPASSISSLDITWTLIDTFNAASGAVNNFTWAVTLPNTILNTNNIPLTGTTAVTNVTQANPVLQTVTVPSTFAMPQAAASANDVIALLPPSAAITTLPASITSLDITWTFNGTFNAGDGAVNNFTWRVTLPDTISNTNNVALTGTTAVTNVTGTGTPPVITKYDAHDGIAGRPYSFTFEATGMPTWFIAEDSVLPPGLVLDADGTLHGIPIFSGVFMFTVAASNGEVAEKEITLIVEQLVTPRPDVPTVIISEGFADRSNEVSVEVSIGNNPGFSDMYLRLNIPSGLTLINHTSHPSLKPFEQANFPFIEWTGNQDNLFVNGPILHLTFSVAPNASYDFKEITATFENAAGPKFPTNEDGSTLTNFVTESGGVTVRVPVAGDVNGDSRVTSADATVLARWLINHNVTIDYDSANMNGDGVSLNTLTTLARRLIGLT